MIRVPIFKVAVCDLKAAASSALSGNMRSHTWPLTKWSTTWLVPPPCGRFAGVDAAFWCSTVILQRTPASMVVNNQSVAFDEKSAHAPLDQLRTRWSGVRISPGAPYEIKKGPEEAPFISCAHRDN